VLLVTKRASSRTREATTLKFVRRLALFPRHKQSKEFAAIGCPRAPNLRSEQHNHSPNKECDVTDFAENTQSADQRQRKEPSCFGTSVQLARMPQRRKNSNIVARPRSNPQSRNHSPERPSLTVWTYLPRRDHGHQVWRVVQHPSPL
jgi:hypothetical protein